MNNRGILHSSITIKGLHEVAKAEFETSRKILVDTTIDEINQQLVKLDKNQLHELAKSRLSDRRGQIESQLKEHAQNIQEGLQNQAITASYMNLSQYNERALFELSVELSGSLVKYEKEQGANAKLLAE